MLRSSNDHRTIKADWAEKAGSSAESRPAALWKKQIFLKSTTIPRSIVISGQRTKYKTDPARIMVNQTLEAEHACSSAPERTGQSCKLVYDDKSDAFKVLPEGQEVR